ncbi:MAG: c-type cytochrome biogenesis protein CcsB [Syntrophobacteria bacterium]
MNDSTLPFSVAVTLLYAVGTVGYLIYIIRSKQVIHRIACGILLAGFLVHSIGLVLLVSHIEQIPVTTLQQTLSFFAWAIVGSYLAVQLKFNIRTLGAFVSPFAVIFMLLSSAIPRQLVPASGLFKSFWLMLHVGTMFVGNAVFAVAFCAGIMYLLQERQIKTKSFGLLYHRLPSLEMLDSVNYVCLTFGFPLITLGLISGFVYAGAVWRSYWQWDPKEILSVITWLIYAVLLHERLAVGWRGRKAAIMAIIGFSAILVTFLGVSIMLKGHHSFKMV